ncbi:MAG: TetR/AcrR family transcriptional regulator [Syntrophomonadaceae bacterium]|nr:TetR/AcrR family transcriptional regulator [Syntrophomonadaceae bacterium]
MAMAPKKSKRDLIIEAAIQVLSRKGYHSTKMEEIAVVAGIGKGTIYEYFPGKLQLLQEILERSFYMYDNSLKADISNSLPFKQKIRALIEGHFRFCQRNKDLTRILFFDTDVIDSELRDWAWQNSKLKEESLQSLVKAAISNGEIRNLDAKMLTVIIIGILGSIWVPIAIEGWDIDAAAAADQITNIIMNGIQK